MLKQEPVAWKRARAEAYRLEDDIRRTHPGMKFEFCGSLRRQEEWVGDLDLVIVGSMHDLSRVPGLSYVSGGNVRSKFLWKGRTIDVWASDRSTYGAAIFCVTGPVEYIVWYAQKAKRKGMSLSYKGLRRADGSYAETPEERDVYRLLDKEWKAPQLRAK